jgi:hypothetical protein
LWHNFASGNATGGTADIVAAIDDAVADGVDVINYSISGSRTSVIDPAEIAFFNAAAVGVFVAASAGNNGVDIGVSSVAHNSPWLTTVGASTHDRGVAKTVTLGNGAVYNGVGVGPVAAGPAALIDSVNAGLLGAPAAAVELCFSDADPITAGIQPALDPAKVGGKIVLCRRGTNARVDKSLAVANAGGIGMILYNPTPNSLDPDFHSVPSIHVDNVAGPAIKAYAATVSPTATISAVLPIPVRAPAMGGFSSFGPALAGNGDLLKPDITAPGVGVIAAVAPPGDLGGNGFNALSGTSMSSPHIAGIAALIRSKYPTWSPMAVKSALMTTASQLDNTNQPIQRGAGNATPLDFGSGHVTPKLAFNPGLVYESGPVEWISYGCALGQFQLITPPGFCSGFPTVDASDLNTPSIAVGDLAGTQTITRTVTNVSSSKSVFHSIVQAPPGFTASVAPEALNLSPGESRSYKVTITRTSAPLGQWAFGSIAWETRVLGVRDLYARSPIAVRPVALTAPAEAELSGTSGSSATVSKVGYTGTLNASVVGLVAGVETPMALDPAGPSFNANAPAVSIQTGRVEFSIPAGTTVARFATFDSDYPPNTDIDLFLYLWNGTTHTLVGSSGGGTADEVITLQNPAAGTYRLYVDLFASGSGALTTLPNYWLLGSSAAGNATVTPASQPVVLGGTATTTLNWSGLTAGVRYLGAILYDDGSGTIGRTLVRVDA